MGVSEGVSSLSIVEVRITSRPHAFGSELGSGKQVYVAAQVVSWAQRKTNTTTGLFRITGRPVRNKKAESGVPLALLERGVESVEVVKAGVVSVHQDSQAITGRQGQVAVVIPSKKYGGQGPWGADRLKGWCRNGDEVFISREPALAIIELAERRPGVYAFDAVLWRNRRAENGGAKWIISKTQQVIGRLDAPEERRMITAAGIARGRDFY